MTSTGIDRPARTKQTVKPAPPARADSPVNPDKAGSRPPENSHIEISTEEVHEPLHRKEARNESGTESPLAAGSSSRQSDLTVQRTAKAADLPRGKRPAEQVIHIPTAAVPAALDLTVARTARPLSSEGGTRPESSFRQLSGNSYVPPAAEHSLPGFTSPPATISRTPQHVASTASSPIVSTPASSGAQAHSYTATPRPTTSTTAPPAAERQNEQDTKQDLKALARELYPHIRRMLIIEKERLPHF
jgi:hypothetical protein